MAIPITLFFKDRNYKIGSNKGFVTFDLILSENHTISNEVTQHVVEDGSEITDHIKNNLESGSLTVLVTNFSLKAFGAFFDRAQDAFDEIIRLWKTRELVTIICVLKVYENVAITNVKITRSAATGDAIVLDISFKQVKVVKLRTVLIDVGVNPKGMKTDSNRQIAAPSDQGRTVGSTP